MQCENAGVQSSKGKSAKAGDCWSSLDDIGFQNSSFLLLQRQASLSRTQKTEMLQVSFPGISCSKSMRIHETLQSGARTRLRWPLRLGAASSSLFLKTPFSALWHLRGKVSHLYWSLLTVWLKASPATTFLLPGSSSVASHKDILSLPLLTFTMRQLDLQLHAIIYKIWHGSSSTCPVNETAVSAGVLKGPVHLVQATEVG